MNENQLEHLLGFDTECQKHTTAIVQFSSKTKTHHCHCPIFIKDQNTPLPLSNFCGRHGLSQQGVWVSFWTPIPLKSTPQDTQIFLCGISLNVNLKHEIEFFHHHIIPMTFIRISCLILINISMCMVEI